MTKRTDLHTILVPGSGPIVIGQAAEFDYSGTQAVKALRREGYRVVLVNSNPATIMTDPELADATYVEPLTADALEAIIRQEQPDAMLPTVGGQTGLNLALALSENGALARHGVQLIGASLPAIKAAEDRNLFRRTLLAQGLPVPSGGPAHTLAEAQALAAQTGYPLLVRASFALGGAGAAWVYAPDELPEALRRAVAVSPIGQAWIEESVLGWKEYELEVMADSAGNFVVVCSIENLDPMGVHTGDSITVAPAQTLTDREYQVLRDLARRVMAAVGVATGGANVQFAVDPATGRVLVIEMNPRVSRSSALASKATGFPIAKLAALVAVGYTLDEIPNDITGQTQAAFEPSLDYVVVKMPRWAFEKFPGVDPLLGPQMKSVGEVMALGSTFPAALNKAVQSLEIGVDALDGSGPKRAAPADPQDAAELAALRRPTADRLFAVYRAVRAGLPLDAISAATGFDPWFLAQMAEIAACEREVAAAREHPERRPAAGGAESKDATWTEGDPSTGAAPSAALSRPPAQDAWAGSETEHPERRPAAGGVESKDAAWTKGDPSTGDASSAALSRPPAQDAWAGSETEHPERRPAAGGVESKDAAWTKGDPSTGDASSAALSRPPAQDAWAGSETEHPERRPAAGGAESKDAALTTVLRRAKRLGFSDSHLARLLSSASSFQLPASIRAIRGSLGILPTFQRVDTCAAEFAAQTPYLYSAYESADEAEPTDRPKILILGSGPNRIGQGIEFDYCCCQAAFALKGLGYETIMLNCNPETVSTDYDTADRLYFEPLTLEHVLNVVEREQPAGVIVQFGGQTPLNLAEGLEAAGVPILGTSPAAIRLAEDRARFADLLARLDIPQPEHGIANSLVEARAIAAEIGYPVLVRPSYVLGGRAMAIVGDPGALAGFVQAAFDAAPGAALLVDRFMEDAFEIDVDALCDGRRVVIGAIMQHIEEAGVHSGDSACVLPPYKVSQYHLNIMREYTERLGLALGVRGLMNVQYALKDDIVYVLEVNPRASRTIPYASKATGVNLAALASRIMAGQTLDAVGLWEEPVVDGFFVKEAVLPFNKLAGADAVLGPEMRSTGEVMGHAAHFGHAFAKSQIAAGWGLPLSGAALISVNDFDKGAALKIARDLHRMGFRLIATPGTAAFLNRAGLPVGYINKVEQGSPHAVDLIRSGEVQLILNTPLGPVAQSAGAAIRAAAIAMDLPLLTTLSAATAAVSAIRALRQQELRYRSLQAHYAQRKESAQV